MKNGVKLYELRKLQTDFPKKKITTPRGGYDFIKQFYSDDIGIFESFFILLLNRNNQTLGYAKISQGGVASTVVDVKIISKYVVDSLCSAVILAHNHPSGNKNPSNADKSITDKIKNALSYFDVQVIDHIILTEEGYFSFSEGGLL